MTKAKPENDDSMRILATGTCDTLSGNSRLTYHIGCTPEGEIHLRVHQNSRAGMFSNEWIALSDILQALKKHPEGKPITSILLQPLFRGKSVNTPAFLLAVLLHEKVVRSLQGKLRGHELGDPSVFTAKVDRLLTGGGDAKGRSAQKPARNTPRKKTAAATSRKKSKTV